MGIFMVVDSGIDSDVLWHIKQGEVYLENGITTKDYLSWQPGLVWPTAEWLYEVIIYFIATYTGTIGFIIVLSLSLYSVYGWQLKKNGLKHPFWFMIIFAITFLFPRNMYNRPGEFQIILTMWIISCIIKNDKYLIFKSSALGLILGNFHGGQIIAVFAVMIIMLVCVYIHQFLSDKTDNIINKPITRIKNIQASIIATFISSLVNPMGIGIYTVGMKVPNMYSTKFITEWYTWDIDYLSGILILLVIISIAAQKDFKEYGLESIQILALICAFTILQIKTQRIAGYLQAIIIIFGYKYIMEFYETILIRFKIKRELDKKEEKPINLSRNSKIIYTAIISGIILFNLYYIMDSVKGVETFDKLVNKKTIYSTESIEYLKENEINTGLLNGYSSGGWLIWNDIKTFVDSRQQPFTIEIQNNNSLDELIKAVHGSQVSEDINSLCDKYNIDYILWNTGEMGYDISEDLVNSGDWEIAVESICSDQSKEYILKRM